MRSGTERPEPVTGWLTAIVFVTAPPADGETRPLDVGEDTAAANTTLEGDRPGCHLRALRHAPAALSSAMAKPLDKVSI